MKKKKRRVLPLAALLTILLLSCPESKTARPPGNREQALKEWRDIYDRAETHRGALKCMERIIRRGETNFSVLVEISRMISEIPFHTEVLLKVADSASQARNGRVDFMPLAELAVITLSESSRVTDLADYASRIPPGEDLDELNRRYERIRETAEAASVKEAVNMVESMRRRIERQASGM